MLLPLLLVCGVPRPHERSLGAPAGVVDPHLKPNHTTPESLETTGAAATAAANSPATAADAGQMPTVSMPQQHSHVDEACLSSGTVSKLQNRLRVEQGEFQLLRGEVDRLSQENALLATMPKLARPPRVGPSTILQHGAWYHLRRGLSTEDARTAGGSKSAGVDYLQDQPGGRPGDEPDGGEEPFGTANWREYLCVVLGLLLVVVFASCLVGLFSISMLDLCVLELQGSDAVKAQAAQLRPLVGQPRRLLVTLLLVYVSVAEAVPLFLDKLMPDWLAIFISVIAILLLGEVLPHAFCNGPNKLAIAAFFSPIVRVFMFVLAPFAWPLAQLLDKILGKRRSSCGLRLDERETTPLSGALALGEKSAGGAMTKWQDAFTLSRSAVLNDEVLADVLVSGCSRIPVWHGNPDSVCGILVVKRLLLVDPAERKAVSEIGLHPPVIVSESTPLLTLFALFQSAHAHLALVLPSDDEADAARRLVAEGAKWPAELKVSGTISIDDIFEELVLEDIADEEESISASKQLATQAEVRSRLRRLHTLGTKRLHERSLDIGEPVAPRRTPLGPGFRKAAAAKDAMTGAAQRDLQEKTEAASF